MATPAESVASRSPEPGSDIAAIERVLHFAVADTDFCIPLQHVIRIFPIVRFRFVPGGPSCLRGLMTIAGKSVPVIDLADRLNMPDPRRYHLETPIILCESRGKTTGLIVDEVFDVEAVDAEHIQMRPLFKKGDIVPVEATVITKRGHLLLLDIQRILDIDLTTVFKDMQDDRRQNANSRE